MTIAAVSGSAVPQAAYTAPSPQTAKPNSNVPKVDNDGDYDNGADDHAPAPVTLNTAASSNPSVGQNVNVKA